jgi:serine/threonine protein kinase
LIDSSTAETIAAQDALDEVVQAPPPDSSQDETILAEPTIPPAGDRYAIQQKIGAGGMGSLYLGRDERLGRQVAIKRIRGDLGAAGWALNRFLGEARAIAQLSHYNIAQVYDVDEDERGHFIAMEYVEGQDLAAYLKKNGAMAPQDAVSIARQLCGALAYAHERGVIHRDIKPSNVLITAQGVPKLVDFGLALVAEENESKPRHETATGIMMGTPDYASPEQLTDTKRVDARSDIFSLGATLFEMATGKPPRVIRESEIPDQLRPIILKAIQPDRDDRYPDAKSFGAALARVELVREMISPLGLCSKCGTQNLADAKFCQRCGADLSKMFAACPDCGRENRRDVEFCADCGANLVAKLQDIRDRAYADTASDDFGKAIANWKQLLTWRPEDREAETQIRGLEDALRRRDINDALLKLNRLVAAKQFSEAGEICNSLEQRFEVPKDQMDELRKRIKQSCRSAFLENVRLAKISFKENRYDEAVDLLTSARPWAANARERKSIAQALRIAQTQKYLRHAEDFSHDSLPEDAAINLRRLEAESPASVREVRIGDGALACIRCGKPVPAGVEVCIRCATEGPARFWGSDQARLALIAAAVVATIAVLGIGVWLAAG